MSKRAWKALPWSAMDQLHEKGYISDPATKNKSVWLSEQGARLSEEFCNKAAALGNVSHDYQPIWAIRSRIIAL